MPKTRFLTLEQVIAIHDDQIENYGGSHGLRDLALLESACLRPQTSFGGKDLYPTIFDKAAAMIHSLILNHPFVDGNKRTAMVSGIVFLEINGFELEVDQDSLIDAALKTRSKDRDIEKLPTWLEENSERIK